MQVDQAEVRTGQDEEDIMKIHTVHGPIDKSQDRASKIFGYEPTISSDTITEFLLSIGTPT